MKHESPSWYEQTITARRCRECHKIYPLTSFYGRFNRRINKAVYDSRCDECRRLQQRLRYMVLTKAQYDALIKHANGVCELCERPLDKPNIDHCHKTGRIRGVLCAACNSGLGALRDDPELMRRAADYIEAWAKRRMSSKERADGQERERRIQKFRAALDRQEEKRRVAREQKKLEADRRAVEDQGKPWKQRIEERKLKAAETRKRRKENGIVGSNVSTNPPVVEAREFLRSHQIQPLWKCICVSMSIENSLANAVGLRSQMDKYQKRLIDLMEAIAEDVRPAAVCSPSPRPMAASAPAGAEVRY